MPLVLSELLAHVSAVELLRQQHKWVGIRPTAEEMALAEREAAGEDHFDRRKLKRGVWEAWGAGTARLVGRALRRRSDGAELARVFCFVPAGVAEPAWEIWAAVFCWFGAAAAQKPWRVFWFAAVAPRNFPLVGQDLGPEHVNGGYTRPCSTEGVFIYRAEEATRVLVHELLHAACLDEQGAGWSLPLREAQIEVWAELILVALLSRGRKAAAERLWGLQSQWVADTNAKARRQHGTRDMTDYAWRYLCGREVMYARLGVALPQGVISSAQHASVRFTHPSLGD